MMDAVGLESETEAVLSCELCTDVPPASCSAAALSLVPSFLHVGRKIE